MNDNNYQQNNTPYNNNNPPPPQQWGPPQQPYSPYNRMRMQEAPAKSPVIPILVICIIVLLVAICLVGGYLLGKNRNDNNNNMPAAVQTTQTVTEPETAAVPTEAATEAPTAAPVTEADTTAAATSVVVEVQVVTEPPKTIFVGDYICDVRVATKSSDLNMRSSPSTSAPIIGSIPKDTIVGFYGYEGSWGIVYYNGKYGYVNTAYISYDLYPSGNYGQYGGAVSYATINANGGLNLRSSDSTSASIITTIPNGKEVTVYYSYDGWSYISYGNDYGYVKSEYLKFK